LTFFNPPDASGLAINNGKKSNCASSMSLCETFEPICVESRAPGEPLYVFFGGISAGINMPPYEFYSASRILDCNKIFVRDSFQAWYQMGLPSISGNIFETAEHLRGMLAQLGAEDVTFVGNSMGGFAAIAICALLGRGRAVAFAPQAFISPWLRLKHRDGRWMGEINRACLRSVFRRRIWDLRKLLRSAPGKPSISVFVSRRDRMDSVHANHLAGLANVKIFGFDEGGHGIVKLLRDKGLLPSIMTGKYQSGE
jgi:pimeloyl-ACP methyl ester carboxylesterase